MVEYEYRVSISAPPDQVWSVLIDFESYGQWNDFYRKVVSRGEVGDSIRMHVTLGRLKVVSIEKIKHREENVSLSWGLENILLHSGVTRTLSAVEGGQTEVTSVFMAAGPIASVSMPLFGKQIQAGMGDFLECLKERVEKL